MSSDRMRIVVSRGKGLSVSLRGGYSRHWLAPDVPTELPDHIALAALQQGAVEVGSAEIVPISQAVAGNAAADAPVENAALAAATEALEAATEVLDAAADAVEAATPRGNKKKAD